MNDDDVVEAMRICRALGIIVCVRGTDDKPIVELKHKISRRVVGGIELKRLMESLRN